MTGKSGETLTVDLEEIISDSSFDLGIDPGLVKDGVEAHLQELLAAQMRRARRGLAAGPPRVPDRDRPGRPHVPGRVWASVAIEIKRRGEIDGVEQLTRYLELLNRDPLLAPVQGIFAAQEIKPQARVLAEDRGIRCVVARLRHDARHRRRRAPALLTRAVLPGAGGLRGPRRPAKPVMLHVSGPHLRYRFAKSADELLTVREVAAGWLPGCLSSVRRSAGWPSSA